MQARIGDLKASEIRAKDESKLHEKALRDETVAFKRRENKLESSLRQSKEQCSKL